MPSASRVRAVEKLAADKKKQWKTSSKSVSGASAASASAYNPTSGTFHMLDSGEANAKLKAFDDTSSLGGTSEYDSISNNGSCSGESEDQLQVPSKEKPCIPGLDVGPDKQEKIRLKNERKHQRQKERKAKELKERCAGYLMSRKLERLAQQLVSMGFPSDKATMALILNEGDMEKSISFLLEDGEAPKEGVQKAEVKVDISEELARIADLEVRYRYPLSEIERAVVACEGDIDGAINWLRDHYSSGPEAAIGQQQHQHQHRSIALQEQATKSIPSSATNYRDPGGRSQVSSGIQKPASGLTAANAPVRPPQVWQRPPVQVLPTGDNGFHSMNPVVAAGTRLDPAMRFFEQQRDARDIIADWRGSQPTSQVIINRGGTKRLDEPHFKQELVPPMHLYNHISSPSGTVMAAAAQPGNSIWTVGPSDSWNVKAAPTVDYQAIDWSIGMPLSPYAKPVSLGIIPRSSSIGNDHGWGHTESMQTGYRELPELSDLVSQEWTTPFAGKDLFQHQPVPSL